MPCTAGTFSNAIKASSVTTCVAVTAGTWSATVAATVDGASCTAGFYCPAPGGHTHSKAVLCEKGYKCPTGSAVTIKCDKTNNEYNDMYGQALCMSCPGGFECTNDPSDSKVKCTPHLTGTNFYCLPDKAERTACPTGKYNFHDRSEALTDCWSCPPGYFCPDTPSPDSQWYKI